MLPGNLKCVHSVLGEQEALVILDQSIEKVFYVFLRMTGSKFPLKGYLSIVYTTLAIHKLHKSRVRLQW